MDKILNHYAYLGNFKAVTMTNYGARILIDTRNKQHYKIITHGVYEKAVAWAIESNLARDEVFVDIGANIGYFTLQACKIVGPKGQVFALEPNPIIYEMMSKSVHINSFKMRCQTLNIGAFNLSSEMDLTWDTANHGGGRLVTNKKVREESNKAKVKLLPLDEVLSDFDKPISVIKIDTEGSEPYVLEGALQTLKKSPNCVIIAEWSPRFVKSRGYDFNKYLDFLFENFSSIESLVKVGETKKVDREYLINLHHGNILLKQ